MNFDQKPKDAINVKAIPSDLITPEEAAVMFRLKSGTLRRWAQLRKIRHYRTPGNEIRFSRKDLTEMTFVVEPVKTKKSKKK